MMQLQHIQNNKYPTDDDDVFTAAIKTVTLKTM